MRVRRWLMLGFILHFSIFSYLYHTRTVLAEETSSLDLEEIRELLNKGLTIYEIDQELERLTIKEAELTEEISEVTEQAAVQETIVAAKRQQAAKVLRSYYKGKRDNLWMFIFRVDNFYEALQTYYYLSLIFKHEQRILEEHALQYQDETSHHTTGGRSRAAAHGQSRIHRPEGTARRTAGRIGSGAR